MPDTVYIDGVAFQFVRTPDPKKGYEVAIVAGKLHDLFMQMLDENGLEMFPIPTREGDLPCFGVRGRRGA